ncbi:MAG: Exosome complex component RRP4, partial [Paramarteilia canceri]
LGLGILVKTYPSLIKHCKTHFSVLPSGVTVIFGNNGYVWIESTENGSVNKEEGSFHDVKHKSLSKSEIKAILRTKICVEILDEHSILLYDTSLAYAFDCSTKYEVICHRL